jgi:hypothetical protein
MLTVTQHADFTAALDLSAPVLKILLRQDGVQPERKEPEIYKHHGEQN